MSQPKISIIIPVYKVEQYIEKCARTLFGQTMDDMEYIFVDDCSPDNSIDIMQSVLEEYPHRLNQVKIIRHDTNKGVSQTRQDGLDASTGEYVIHCDPDDWVELDMYESLYNKAKETNADLVLCDYYSVKGDRHTYRSEKPEQLNSQILLEGLTDRLNHAFHGSLWNKLLKSNYSKSAIFPHDISYREDTFYWLQILKKEIKIEYLNRALYYYRYNAVGLVNSITNADQEKDLKLINHIQEIIADSSDKRYILACFSFIIGVIYYRFFKGEEQSNKCFKNNFKSFQKYISANRRIGRIDKILLWISMNGYRSQSKIIYSIFINLKARMRSYLGVVSNL